MTFTFKYDFADFEEERPYGDGYGNFSYGYETVTDGIAITTDNDDNIIKWYGYGHYDYEVGEIKTLKGLMDFIREHYKEIDTTEREELVEELLETIQVNIDRNYRKCFNDQFADGLDALKRLGVEKCL